MWGYCTLGNIQYLITLGWFFCCLETGVMVCMCCWGWLYNAILFFRVWSWKIEKTDFFLFKCTTCVELSLLLLFISKFLCGLSSLSDCSAFQRVPFTASYVALEHFCSLRERMVFSLKSFSLSSASDLIIWAPFVLPLSGQRRGGWNNCSCTIGAVDRGI